MDTIILDSFFESAEIESDYLKNLLEKVLAMINKPNLHFGKIYEGRISDDDRSNFHAVWYRYFLWIYLTRIHIYAHARIFSISWIKIH